MPATSTPPSRGRKIPKRPPVEGSPPIIQAVRRFQQHLSERLEDISVPPTPDEILMETTAVARMAAIAGDLETAIKGFKAAGDMLGMGQSEPSTHNHLHLHQTAGNMLDADDNALRELIAAAKAKPAEIEQDRAALPASPAGECQIVPHVSSPESIAAALLA